MKHPTVEFTNFSGSDYGWMLRYGQSASVHPYLAYKTHKQAINAFKAFADGLDIRAPIEIVDGQGVQGSHAMLIGK